MIKVGLTGGIGSGKTLIGKVFAILGVPVYNADLAAKTITDTDPEIRTELIKLFGDTIYNDAHLDRRSLLSVIFNDNEKLLLVNRIIHPKVARHFLEWCNMRSGYAYIIQEAAILFESNAYLIFDRIITVTAPENIRMERILTRKEMTKERATSIMEKQISDEEKINRSDYVIKNDGKNLILPQILQIHLELNKTV